MKDIYEYLKQEFVKSLNQFTRIYTDMEDKYRNDKYYTKRGQEDVLIINIDSAEMRWYTNNGYNTIS